jgi:hypothetical protein
MFLPAAPRAVVEELLFSHIAEMDVPYAAYRWLCDRYKAAFYENLVVDELEFLFCPAGFAAEKGVTVDGRLPSTFEAIDAYAILPGVAYFAQVKSTCTSYNAKQIGDWFGKAASFVSRDRHFDGVTSSTERVALFGAPHYVRGGANAVTDESLKRIRDANPSWTLLLFDVKQRGRLRIFSPFDDWSLRWTWARLQQSPRALASLHVLRSRSTVLHRELSSAPADATGVPADALAACVAPDATGALFSPDAGTLTPYEFTIALAENRVDNGVELRLRPARPPLPLR